MKNSVKHKIKYTGVFETIQTRACNTPPFTNCRVAVGSKVILVHKQTKKNTEHQSTHLSKKVGSEEETL